MLATKFHTEHESHFNLQYEQLPHVGQKPPQVTDADYHTWNEQTMNQLVRKMQYAVRGSVVMKADEMEAEGKEILYSKYRFLFALNPFSPSRN